MSFDLSFFVNSILFGIGLAMDAFSVSLCNGLNEPNMKKSKICTVAGVFAVFQFLMPITGWLCVSSIAQLFVAFEKLIPWIALVLLLYIGGKMLLESIHSCGCCEDEPTSVCFKALILQGIATSIDALSVGFTIAHYDFLHALVSCLLIGVVTFFICVAGIIIGKKAGTRLAGKAGILGGAILIFIGIEIFVSSLV